MASVPQGEVRLPREGSWDRMGQRKDAPGGHTNISPPSMEESLAHVGQNITPLPGRRHSSPERVTLPKSTGASGGHTSMKVREDGATLEYRASHTVSSVRG